MIVAAMLLALGFGQAVPEGCRQIDDAMLALSLHDFDQGDDGWRGLDVEGCELAAAEAISRYQVVNREALAGEYLNTLVWHEGQLRAAAGQYEPAIALMLSTKAETTESFALYVDATVAFLRGDRATLEATRAQLSVLPEPDYYRQAIDRFRATYPDKPAPTWPPNLHVVDGLIACFGQSYKDAYGCDVVGNAP